MSGSPAAEGLSSTADESIQFIQLLFSSEQFGSEGEWGKGKIPTDQNQSQMYKVPYEPVLGNFMGIFFHRVVYSSVDQNKNNMCPLPVSASISCYMYYIRCTVLDVHFAKILISMQILISNC